MEMVCVLETPRASSVVSLVLQGPRSSGGPSVRPPSELPPRTSSYLTFCSCLEEPALPRKSSQEWLEHPLHPSLPPASCWFISSQCCPWRGTCSAVDSPLLDSPYAEAGMGLNKETASAFEGDCLFPSFTHSFWWCSW